MEPNDTGGKKEKKIDYLIVLWHKNPNYLEIINPAIKTGPNNPKVKLLSC